MNNRGSIVLLGLLALLCSGTVVQLACQSQLAKEEMSTDSDMNDHAILETTFGRIELELYRADAPKTVENFVGLAEQGLYDSVSVHRVAKGFVIQTGDINGQGGTSIWGKPFADELNSNAPSYQRGYVKGTVAMANRGPNTNTSQFFITLKDLPSLPKNYTIFGLVTNGMEVVEEIGAVDVIPQLGPTDGRPKVEIMMKKVTIVRGGAKGSAEE
jgi:cyclophilin family peptidyl-prolyl cis-trans isomerase